VSGSDIRSNEVFANLLRAEGIEPETKPGKRGENYAFAKTDQFMRDLLEDGEPRVQALVGARLAEKSNIVQTRSARLCEMSRRGAMCVYLAPCGAHTTRWSGGDKLNWQNFPRESELGKAIEAPQGSALVIVDASQIECRLLNYIAGQWDVIERFARKEDVYCHVASQFYGYPVNKNDHPVERQNGKIWELMGGYGAGPRRYGQQTRIATGGKVVLSHEDEQGACDAYRSTHPAVTSLWQTAGDVLKNINNGFDFDWLVFKILNKRMYLPNGLFLNYESLHWFEGDDAQERGWRLQTRKGSVKMYGAKLVENFIQALSACHIRLVWGKIGAGVKVVSMEHDKLILCVYEGDAEAVLRGVQELMREPPPWAPGIPLDSEGYVSRTFKREK
jgi:DNA polymerase